ncbi:MAG: radical SAM protein [archaeon]
MAYTILDCYTDEPAGLGVPPYLGTYPRYIYGALLARGEKPHYLTIDDVRLYRLFSSQPRAGEIKTNIRVHNLTRNSGDVHHILNGTKTLVVIAGIQTPGKYLAAVPGTLYEVSRLISGLKCRRILAGPAADIGTRLEGGKMVERLAKDAFDEVESGYLGTDDYKRVSAFAVRGAEILSQIPYPVIAELETGRGCMGGTCSFCTEPLKYRLEYRESSDIIKEARMLRKAGVEYFRLGKQSCFYSYRNGDAGEIENLLRGISRLSPQVLHIDNANPNFVDEKKTRLIVRYCTSGNVAALGAESFDADVVAKNRLNATPESVMRAVRIINRHGRARGRDGLPMLLPGINIILGLNGETRETLELNHSFLQKILDDGLMLRRINIRQVVPFPGTELYEKAGVRFIRKNKRRYWGFRNKIRQNIDYPMLQRLVPKGTILRNVRMEIYDGNTTFGRQFGTYPLIVGVKGRHPLGKICDVMVVDHMLRSVVGTIA